MNYKARMVFLVTIFSAIVLTFSKFIGHSEVKDPIKKTYIFPESVALASWTLVASQSINAHLVQPPAYISGNFLAGKHYSYHQNNQLLEIEMRYLSNTNGDLKSFIISQTGELSPVLQQDNEGGFYGLYTYQQKAYLSTCINPRGSSTVTSDRFKRNRMIYDTRLPRIMLWLTGQQELHDHRCLWAHLSMPLATDVPLDETYHILKTAWQDWHNWWQSNYPEA